MAQPIFDVRKDLNGQWSATFRIGVQEFSLKPNGDEEHAWWYVDMLKHAFKVFEEQVKKEIQGMLKIELWAEGFVIQGTSANATHLGTYVANSFEDAIDAYNNSLPESTHKIKKGGLIDGKTMKPIDGYTLWGCRIFDNELDARRSYG